MDNLPDEDVVIKISTCNKCEGIVRSSIKHMMTTKTKNSFAKEVMEYNLTVKEQPLIEYLEEGAEWCKCK